MATQIIIAAGSAATNFVFNEVPAGTINGVNDTFTLAFAPSPAGSLKLYKNGSRLTATIDFTLTSLTIVYVAGAIPIAGDAHIADYLR